MKTLDYFMKTSTLVHKGIKKAINGDDSHDCHLSGEDGCDCQNEPQVILDQKEEDYRDYQDQEVKDLNNK